MISVKHAPMSSHELYERLLRDYHLQMEMLAGTYVLAMTTVGDTQGRVGSDCGMHCLQLMLRLIQS